jgi:hypothetical protein
MVDLDLRIRLKMRLPRFVMLQKLIEVLRQIFA